MGKFLFDFPVNKLQQTIPRTQCPTQFLLFLNVKAKECSGVVMNVDDRGSQQRIGKNLLENM